VKHTPASQLKQGQNWNKNSQNAYLWVAVCNTKGYYLIVLKIEKLIISMIVNFNEKLQSFDPKLK
jgi:hypothetical protein